MAGYTYRSFVRNPPLGECHALPLLYFSRPMGAAFLFGLAAAEVGVLCRRAVVAYDGHFCRGVAQGFDDFFQGAGHFVAVGRVAALRADEGRHVFDDDDVMANIDHEGGFFLFQCTFAHKAVHDHTSFLIFPLTSHRAGSG